MTTQITVHRVTGVTSEARDFDWGATVELEIQSKTRSGEDLGVTSLTMFCDNHALAHVIADAIRTAVASVPGTLDIFSDDSDNAA